MASSSNRLYIARLWVPALMGLLFVGAVAAQSLMRGKWVPLGVMAACATIVIALARVLPRRRLARLMLEPGPEPLIGYVEQQVGRLTNPHVALICAVSAATYRALWGEFEVARLELKRVSFAGAPDLHRADEYRVLALIEVLSRGDYTLAARHAERAQRLAAMPNVPGAGALKALDSAMCTITQMLSDGPSDGHVHALQALLPRAQPPYQQLIQWGLAVALRACGRGDEAGVQLAQLRERAPYWAPLQTLDLEPPPQAASASAPEAELAAMCAHHPTVASEATCIRCGGFACAACVRGVSSARYCSDCHAGFIEQRETHRKTEGQLVALGAALRIGGWATLAVGLAVVIAVIVATADAWAGFGALVVPGVGVSLAIPRGTALAALQPSGRSGLVLIALGLLIAFPFGWLVLPLALKLLLGKAGRTVLSPAYARTVTATPEQPPRMSRGLFITVLAIGFGTLLLMLSATINFV